MFSTGTLTVFTAMLAYATAAPTQTTVEGPSGTLSAPLSKRTDHYGPATFYYQGGAAGSCGQYHSDSDHIGALSPYWMKQNKFCGRSIHITNRSNGRTVDITVADTCPGCDENHIDLSTGAFKQLTGGQLDPPGEIDIVWHFNA